MRSMAIFVYEQKVCLGLVRLISYKLESAWERIAFCFETAGFSR